MKYGAILKACRTRSDLSQEELAHRLHINQSDVSKYENGTKEPTISLFQAWLNNTQAQEVMVAYLYGLDGIAIMQQLIESLPTISTLGSLLLRFM
ncbi:helix-turn-helix domain-containing protein [Oceanobacillus alkalisoli]|uniref:helix-turn-helix domain-containing protein n=1 Tax=Oceanobacillus alkalisoli TaxID=2925113 RepID=UPI001F119DEB|nr:helix-turn-helix domain-containing protein [Oceanobacillus alkalisoli]MCF3941600.1 helix-turn-helix domain-containing protein [Oceanobacillus alkalisoli]